MLFEFGQYIKINLALKNDLLKVYDNFGVIGFGENCGRFRRRIIDGGEALINKA